jgi:lysosomal alpha-mannosidase
MAFFWRWWMNQHDYVRHSVKKLVDNGQLEFVHGGWVSNDEATAHYTAIIDQMTFGLRKLNETFGKCGRPRIAWQIDPFGHSKEQASLFAQMGLDGLFFSRLHNNDRETRWKNKEMEMIWRGNEDLGESSDVMTSIFWKDYSPPPGFCFDEDCGDDAIIDNDLYADPKLKNVDAKVNQFIEYATNQSKSYKTNHILVTMGGDFQYRNADRWYNNLDKLIRHVNEKQESGSNVNVFYSTPSCYLKALNDSGTKWSTKTDDFFPYATGDHSYWTGYYTSRPSLKRFIRESNAILQVCKKMDALAGLNSSDLAIIDIAKEAVALVQHHDGVSGTAQQHVTFDYAKRLSRGMEECEKVFNDVIKPDGSEESSSGEQTLDSNDDKWIRFCPLLNISICDVSQNNKQFTVTVFNGLGRNQTQYLRIPVEADEKTAFTITGPNGESIKGTVTSNMGLDVPIAQSKAQLIFPANLPPLGYAAYKITKGAAEDSDSDENQIPSTEEDDTDAEIQVVSNQHFGVKFRRGLLHSIIQNGLETKITQNFYWYSPMKYDNDTKQASGAYIFRPNGTKAFPVGLNGELLEYKLVWNDYVKEMRQKIAPWLTQVIRIYDDRPQMEYEWTIGPIPVDDKEKVGKEIVTRFSIPDIRNAGVFYTDSNGRQIMKRTRDYQPTYSYPTSTEPVASNYYPITSMVYIKDAVQQLSILTDRAQGATSLEDGSIEIMVHRRLLQDDGYGVVEPLNEPGVDGKGLIVRGRHWALLTPPSEGPKAIRTLASEVFNGPVMLFNPGVASSSPSYWGIKTNVPPQINVLTVEQWHKETVLIRLEHMFQSGEDPVLSAPINVDLANMFAPVFTVVNATELTLSANRPVGDMSETKFQSTKNSVRHYLGLEGKPHSGKATRKHRTTDLKINMKPMEIRTFRCDIQRT